MVAFVNLILKKMMMMMMTITDTISDLSSTVYFKASSCCVYITATEYQLIKAKVNAALLVFIEPK